MTLKARDLFDEMKTQHEQGQGEDGHGTTHAWEWSNLRAEVEASFALGFARTAWPAVWISVGGVAKSGG